MQDISKVPADLVVPELGKGDPAAGLRVKQTHPEYRETGVYHVLYLPEDWEPGKRYPVIVEYAGNGPYKNKFGDVSTGLVEGSRLGYGMSAGKGYIWLCLPYLNGAGDKNVRQWWGDKPTYDPGPTVEYCKRAVPWVCEKYGGDPERVILSGFSRGAIACNYIGLHDDEIAKLWRAFVPFSHYDGVRENWGYPKADRESAKERLARLDGRPQFILSEINENSAPTISETNTYLKSTGIDLSNITLKVTGFRNHNDSWILRPGWTRVAVRTWLEGLKEK